MPRARKSRVPTANQTTPQEDATLILETRLFIVATASEAFLMPQIFPADGLKLPGRPIFVAGFGEDCDTVFSSGRHTVSELGCGNAKAAANEWSDFCLMIPRVLCHRRYV